MDIKGPVNTNPYKDRSNIIFKAYDQSSAEYIFLDIASKQLHDFVFKTYSQNDFEIDNILSDMNLGITGKKFVAEKRFNFKQRYVYYTVCVQNENGICSSLHLCGKGQEVVEKLKIILPFVHALL